MYWYCYFVFMVPPLLLSLCDCFDYFLYSGLCGSIEFVHQALLNMKFSTYIYRMHYKCAASRGHKTALACLSPRNGSSAPITFHVADHPAMPHVIPQLGLGVGLF